MCKWMQKQVEDYQQLVDVYQIGKQQLWNMVGWTSEGYRAYAGVNRCCGGEKHILRMNAESLAKGMWIVVELSARFGRMSAPVICHSFTSMRKAVTVAARLTLYAAPLDDYEIAHCYEVWHIVDDAELWQEWDNASAAYVATHQPLVPQMQPVAIDSRDCADFYETLYSVYVPMVGQNVSFLVVNRYACGSWLEEEEYMPCDMQSAQPLSIEDCQWCNWMDHNDLYELWFSEQGYAADERAEQEQIDAQLYAWDCDFDALESLRQLREAGAIA